jgi:quercetin dioxygenase-like cupin family protein
MLRPAGAGARIRSDQLASPDRVTDPGEKDNLVYHISATWLSNGGNPVINTVRADDRRRTETPNARMATLASPTLGATAGLSMWQVEMTAGARGPEHTFDSEQVWTVLEGALVLVASGQNTTLRAGDTVVLPAGAQRQLAATTGVRALVCGHGDAIVRVPGEDAPRGTPPWIV